MSVDAEKPLAEITLTVGPPGPSPRLELVELVTNLCRRTVASFPLTVGEASGVTTSLMMTVHAVIVDAGDDETVDATRRCFRRLVAQLQILADCPDKAAMLAAFTTLTTEERFKHGHAPRAD